MNCFRYEIGQTVNFGFSGFVSPHVARKPDNESTCSEVVWPVEQGSEFGGDKKNTSTNPSEKPLHWYDHFAFEFRGVPLVLFSSAWRCLSPSPRAPPDRKFHFFFLAWHVQSRLNLSRFLGRGCDEALFSEKKGVFSEKGEGNSVNEGFGKDFYRKGNSVNRRTLKIEKLVCFIPFPKVSSYQWIFLR